MSLGPVEVLVVAFPENRFSGAILPELQRLVETGTISIIDGLFVRKDADGTTTFDELHALDGDAGALAEVLDRVEGLVSEEDVAELTATLEPNSSAAVLVFENVWAKGLRDAIVDAGGELAANVRVPAAVVDEILATVPDED
jgi:hypothetical protein